MSWRFRKPSKDANHEAIAKALVCLGYDVEDFAHVGGGVCDVLVGIRSRKCLVLIEIKRPFVPGTGMSRKDVRLRKSQQDFHRKWAGYPVFVADTLEQAVEQLKQVERSAA